MQGSAFATTVQPEPINDTDDTGTHDPCNKIRDNDDAFMERTDATVADGGNGHVPKDPIDVRAGADTGPAVDDYDATGASYAALFAVGGLFSEFVADQGGDFWDNTDMMMMGTTTTTTTAVAMDQVPVPVQGLPYASVVDAIDALLATCPRLAECKPATLALPRAPMIYVIKRHMRDYGGADFGPMAGGPCATLDEACKRIDGLGPSYMLDRGVLAWVAGRIMDRVRPGSSHGIPVTPLSHIGSHIRRHFGHDRWVLEDPEVLDLCIEQPEHAPLRTLIAWIVDSARTVAVLRARAATDGTLARQPRGKDYTNGPLKCLAKERDAHVRREATDSASWATFLREQADADKARQASTDKTRQTKKRRRLARTHPVPAAASTPREQETASVAPATSTATTTTGPGEPGRALLTSSLPVVSTAHPMAVFAPPLLPPAPPVQAPAPTTLDVTTLDRQILAQIQSFALMSLAAAGPAGITSGAPITFMAPSVSCPGTMALTCWVTVPSDTDAAPPAASKSRVRGERPRKRPKRSRKTSSRRGQAAVGAAADGATGADAGIAPVPTVVPATNSDKHDTAAPTADQPPLSTAEPATQPTATVAPTSPKVPTSLSHNVPAQAPTDAAGAAESCRPCQDDPMEMTGAADNVLSLIAAPDGDDETIEQGLAPPCAAVLAGAMQQPYTVPGVAAMPLADHHTYDLDQLLCGDGEDDWDALLACGQLPPA
ncbi:RNase E G incomplete domain containing protein [Pandoravirus quercus]|uniref:RNase E G incomplete domain containing protein n=1 Tax=Pandoravirus quercus TaxID=2107709 RepID=A0A2U7UAW6_9VIRU|nr:RNase E G incomplete domain containing protein [Pandoravirus quercus]AVK75525.1 RNase E G incomplete domain containing protein [Pandoravirus quercus]